MRNIMKSAFGGKKMILALALGLLVFAVAGSQVLAGGDKVRGDEATGDANQYQEVDCQAWDEWCIENN